MKNSLFSILLLICSLLAALSAHAETRYVSDQLIITVREGKGSDQPLVTSLRTDAPVEVLEEDDKYLKIRTEDGLEGYVLNQYITTEVPRSITIRKLEKEIAKLQGKVKELESEKAAMKGHDRTAAETISGLEKELAAARKKLDETTAQYTALKEQSGNVIEIAADRDRLETENGRLAKEIEELTAENASLLRTGMIKWFIAGGGVFFFGWLLGKLGGKKRRF